MTDTPLYEGDSQAWQAHLAVGNAIQPRKRVSADVLIRDHAGRILLVDPVYKPDWDTPGGMAEANEPPPHAARRERGTGSSLVTASPPPHAARRELREELGLDIQVGRLLVVDWVPPHGPWDDLLAFVFDGGELTGDQIAGITLMDDELRAFDFCTPEQARIRLRPYVWRRVATALDVLETGRAQYLQDGRIPGLTHEGS